MDLKQPFVIEKQELKVKSNLLHLMKISIRLLVNEEFLLERHDLIPIKTDHLDKNRDQNQKMHQFIICGTSTDGSATQTAASSDSIIGENSNPSLKKRGVPRETRRGALQQRWFA